MKGLNNLVMSKDFQILSIIFFNGSANVQNVIQMALKWLFFLKKLQKLLSGGGGLVCEVHRNLALDSSPFSPLQNFGFASAYIMF